MRCLPPPPWQLFSAGAESYYFKFQRGICPTCFETGVHMIIHPQLRTPLFKPYLYITASIKCIFVNEVKKALLVSKNIY